MTSSSNKSSSNKSSSGSSNRSSHKNPYGSCTIEQSIERIEPILEARGFSPEKMGGIIQDSSWVFYLNNPYRNIVVELGPRNMKVFVRKVPKGDAVKIASVLLTELTGNHVSWCLSELIQGNYKVKL